MENAKLKLAGVFLAGVLTGLAVAYLTARFEVMYIGAEGIGYYDFAKKACFMR